MSDKPTAYRFEPQSINEETQAASYANQEYAGHQQAVASNYGDQNYQPASSPAHQPADYQNQTYQNQTYIGADGQTYMVQPEHTAYAANQQTLAPTPQQVEGYTTPYSDPQTSTQQATEYYPHDQSAAQFLQQPQETSSPQESNPYLDAHRNATQPFQSEQQSFQSETVQPDLYHQQTGYSEAGSLYPAQPLQPTGEMQYEEGHQYAGQQQYYDLAQQPGSEMDMPSDHAPSPQTMSPQQEYTNSQMLGQASLSEQSAAHGIQTAPYSIAPHDIENDAHVAEPHTFDNYHEEIEGEGRKSFLVGTMILGVIVIGGGIAAAYKYSTPFIGQSDNAPIIISDGSARKDLPNQAGGKVIANQNKKIYDRLGNGSQSSVPAGSINDSLAQSMSIEQLRGQITAQSNAGVRTIEDQLNSSITDSSASSSSQKSTTVPGAPRRVKTVMVRPDGSFVSSSSGALSAVINNQRVDAIDGVRLDSGPSRKVRTLAATKANSGTGRQLSRQREQIKTRAAEVLTNRSANSQISRARNGVTALSGGNYVVQVSSRRSQTDALASFSSLKQKYPNILQGYRPLIQRADLGSKGVWYRLRIGPMANKSAASNICSKLKTRGLGSCLVRPR